MTRAPATTHPPRKANLRSNSPQGSNDLGAALRSYREWKGLTLEQLAEILTARGAKVSPSMISNIERGANRGSLPMRRRLFDFLSLEGKG